jgi:hypothetical protein
MDRFKLISSLPNAEDLIINNTRPFVYNYLISKIYTINEAYLWDRTRRDPKDELELKFLNNFEEGSEQFRKIYLYGYHIYGGYYGIFTPDLTEVCKLIGSTLEKSSVYFVTTEPCDISGNVTYDIRMCYDNRHRGRTTVYY